MNSVSQNLRFTCDCLLRGMGSLLVLTPAAANGAEIKDQEPGISQHFERVGHYLCAAILAEAPRPLSSPPPSDDPAQFELPLPS